MPQRLSADSARLFSSLADIVGQSQTSKEVYAAICVAATVAVPECDHASLMICRDGTFSTVGVSDLIARKVDSLEVALRSGPCIDAIEKQSAQIESDLTSGHRWPELAERVVAETPVRGAMSVQLPIDRSKVGALGLFSDRRNAFNREALQRAVLLASFATVATNAVRHVEEAATLRRGLASNRVIGTAIGMLMVRHDVSADEAFAILRRMSQNTNVKITDVATAVIGDQSRRAASSTPLSAAEQA